MTKPMTPAMRKRIEELLAQRRGETRTLRGRLQASFRTPGPKSVPVFEPVTLQKWRQRVMEIMQREMRKKAPPLIVPMKRPTPKRRPKAPPPASPPIVRVPEVGKTPPPAAEQVITISPIEEQGGEEAGFSEADEQALRDAEFHGLNSAKGFHESDGDYGDLESDLGLEEF